MAKEWLKYTESTICHPDHCKPEYKDKAVGDISNFESTRFLSFDPTTYIFGRFMVDNNTDLFYERLYMFDDWSDHYPILSVENGV